MRGCTTVLAWVGVLALCGAAEAAEALPTVRTERPRLFYRASDWKGLTVRKVKGWMDRPEYQAHYGDLKGVAGDALKYLLKDDAEAAARVVKGYDYQRQGRTQHAAGLLDLKAPTGRVDSPSYTGLALTQWAFAYDALHDHPDFKDHREKAIAYLEWWGDWYKRYLSPGVVPFYSRNSGALVGLTAVALALHGDSDKAPGYLEHAFTYLRENMGTIRQAEDGATGGGTYGYVHEFTDLVHTVTMWVSATDWDAATWIRENQGDWLQRQALWQIWSTYPPGWLWKEGDIWSGSHRDRNEHAQAVAGVATLYRNGYARTHVINMRKRWGKAVYYHTKAWMFFLDNDPTVEPKPLSGLGRADVFSPDLHAFVCWRSSWDPEATIIHFKAGENVDHHGTWDTGKFTIFSHGQPLAIKSGSYSGGYMGQYHHFYKLPYSANCVIFDHPRHNGWQPKMPDLDGYASWKTWKARRDKVVKWPPTGRLLKHEATDAYARAVADLSGATYPTGSTWTRELVFLGYKYLLVLDRVTPGKDVTTKWLLQSIRPAAIDAANDLVTITRGDAKLFSKTLLPEGATFKETGLIPVERKGKTEMQAYSYPYRDYKTKKRLVRSFPKGWFYGKAEQMVGHGRVEVIPKDPAAPCTYLHVLVPADKSASAMPACSVKQAGADLVVTVGDLSYTFSGTK